MIRLIRDGTTVDQATRDGKSMPAILRHFAGRKRERLPMMLLGLGGGLLFAAELAFQRAVPSVIWFALFTVAWVAWLASSGIVPRTRTETPAIEPGNTHSHRTQGPEPMPQAVRTSAPLGGLAVVLSAVSHEIRTPINAIVGFAELLRDGDKNAAGTRQREDYAQLVLANARQLQQVVNDILDANRLEAGELVLSEQDCDFGEIVEVVARQCSTEAQEQGISIIAHVAHGLLLHADSNRLKKAVYCLLQNAIKFSPTDGMVNINMLRGPKGELVLSITDAGAGLKADDIEHAFQPFRQLDEGPARHHNGLGLGLYISRQIARLHGGELLLIPQVGVGTEARFILPASRVKLASPHGNLQRVA
jgi:signal transduction histidine kinase